MNRFLIYRLTWNQAKNKYDKKPVGLDGSTIPEHGGIPTADRASVTATIARLGSDYRLGVWIEPPYFFLDLDENAVIDGVLSPQASTMAAALIHAGCYFEASSSGRGAHVIGRYSGELPDHRIQPQALHPHAFYTHSRGCVLSDAHIGDWDTDATPAVLALLKEYFPPRNDPALVRPLTAGARPEWRGPADDDLLILRMLGATGSALSRLSGKVPLSKLWAGECEHNNESDMALAAHLAFWTGCDMDRMERLMRRSPLARYRVDKWDSHRTYLRELTITQVCATTTAVYIEPQRVDTATALLGVSRPPMLVPPPSASSPVVTLNAVNEPDWFDIVERVIEQINSAPTYKELMKVIGPNIGAMGLPKLQGEAAVAAFQRKTETFGTKHSVTDIRALLMPRLDVSNVTQLGRPEWSLSLVYVKTGDKIFDIGTAEEYTYPSARAAFNRHMTMKPNGTREDVVEALIDKWSIEIVHDIQYRPDQEPLFFHAGKRYANSFSWSTLPVTVAGSDECAACIGLFEQHLWQIVNHRPVMYWALLYWIAYNVQKPGHKIRWSPLIKGVPGDGKSIIGDLFFAALGEANVKITSPETLSNSGGFTDWAIGGCVNVIEEIRLEGKERRKLYNSLKNIVGDNRVNPNRKGRASSGAHTNITNHMALTNYEDGMPMDNGDRRWGVIFTPWPDADAAARVKGLTNADALPAFFKRLGASMRNEPGAWRAWLVGIDLSLFDPDGRAPLTDEREAMMHSSEDYIEQTVRDVIEQGGSGVDIRCFCSSSLMGRTQVALGETPDKKSWNKILTNLGYRQVKPTWWMGKTRRIWIKNPLTNDEILAIMNTTVPRVV